MWHLWCPSVMLRGAFIWWEMLATLLRLCCDVFPSALDAMSRGSVRDVLLTSRRSFLSLETSEGPAFQNVRCCRRSESLRGKKVAVVVVCGAVVLRVLKCSACITTLYHQWCLKISSKHVGFLHWIVNERLCSIRGAVLSQTCMEPQTVAQKQPLGHKSMTPTMPFWTTQQSSSWLSNIPVILKEFSLFNLGTWAALSFIHHQVQWKRRLRWEPSQRHKNAHSRWPQRLKKESAKSSANVNPISDLFFIWQQLWQLLLFL